MKVSGFLIQLLVLIVFLGCTTHHKTKEYFKNGRIKCELFYKKDTVLDGLSKYYYEEGGVSEEMIYEEGILKHYRTFYRGGELSFEAQMEGKLKNGLSKECYKNGSLKNEAEYSLGHLIRYNEFDSLGTMVYWYKELQADSLPKFSDEFIKIINVTDTGFFVQAEVPGISPFQLIPFITQGRGRVIDGSKALWFIAPKLSMDSLLKVGVRVAVNDTVDVLMGWKEVVLSDLKND